MNLENRLNGNNHRIHPFEYQGAKFLFDEERALLADDMGMFKTAQSIFANSRFREKKRNMRTLIVCPASVREHWARELQKWAYPSGEINIVYGEDNGYSISEAKKADWTVVSYSLLANLKSEFFKKLQNIGFHHTILDECHNAKNPEALRTKAVKTLSDQSDFVSLLSGTPIPNTIADLYALMSILDPAAYPFDPKEPDSALRARQRFINMYVREPQIVKNLFHQKMLRREAKDLLSEHIPELIMHRIALPLEGAQLDVYYKVLEKNIKVGNKITPMLLASIDPNLVNGFSLESGEILPSVKYECLDEMVDREMSKPNGKLIVFSDLKEGIINRLVEKYRRLGAISITGDIAPAQKGRRENLRKQFQFDPKTRILFSTTVMNEGVDLTAGTGVFNLTIPWAPAPLHQRYKRTLRPGEIPKESVDVYLPYTTIPGPQASIEQATLEMLDSKERIVNYFLQGSQVSLEELKEYEEPKKVQRIVRAITHPNMAVFNEFVRWRGIGSKRALKRLKRDPQRAKYIAELYSDFDMSKNSADIYIPIIKELEKRKKLKTKVDIACGPGVLSHYLGEETIGVDIYRDMLKVGKEINPGRKLIQSSMNELPLGNSIADLVVCSLAYQMSEPNKQRAQTLQEMNRILNPKGYVIFTLPVNYLDTKDAKRFENILGKYGFDIKDHQNGLGHSKIELYVLQKAGNASDRVYKLKWKGDYFKGK